MTITIRSVFILFMVSFIRVIYIDLHGFNYGHTEWFSKDYKNK